ncbi:hypothetical protein [Sporosarcina sp. E16_8]|uniref:hypothetical protein n=1 Tax=Sporosarcina sp. E16_8 TaxID=2789295 RepID=UPI001A926B1C|nr:hypothetical protein [Sporosarcina sp. E16_8]MBO0586446.1 hypothetical protein [Sporosarcina sp. E16_8]
MVKKKMNDKKPFYKKWWVIAIVAFIVIGVIFSPTEEEKAAEVKAEKVPVVAETKTPPVLTEKEKAESEIEKIITDKIDSTTNMKKTRIVEAISNDLGNDTRTISITLNASENLTNKMTRRMMWMESAKILDPLSKIEGVENILIEWMFPLSDQYGNTEDGRIMMFSFPKEVYSKMNWENFDVEKIPNVVNEYFEHPALSK